MQSCPLPFTPLISTVFTEASIAVSQQCLSDRLRLYEAEMADVSVVQDGLLFVGNGYVGMGGDGELRISGGKMLNVATG